MRKSHELFIGIDPSFTKNAFVVIGKDGHTKAFSVISTKPDKFPHANKSDSIFVRAEYIVEKIIETLIKWNISIDTKVLFCIEEYRDGGRKMGSSAYGRGTLDYITTRGLTKTFPNCEIIRINPTTVKQFCTGKGNAGKPDMIYHAMKKYGEDVSFGDIAGSGGVREDLTDAFIMGKAAHSLFHKQFLLAYETKALIKLEKTYGLE